MTARIKAINALRPKAKLERTVGTAELVEYLAIHTGLSEGQVRQVVLELRDAVPFFLGQGYGVKVEGLGVYLPSLKLDGTLGAQYRLDPQLRRLLAQHRYSGKISNRENLGKTAGELVALWNEMHPDDPVDES